MSYGEKLALCAKITQLNPEGLLGLIDIIKARDPSQLSYAAEDDSLDFDIKSLSNDTLWAVREFVNQRFSKEQTTPRVYPLEGDGEEEGEEEGDSGASGGDSSGVGVAPLAGASGGSLVGLGEEVGDVGDLGAGLAAPVYGVASGSGAPADSGLTGRQRLLLRRSSSSSTGGGVAGASGGSATGLRRLSRRQASAEQRRRLQQQQDEANKAKWRQNVASQQKVRWWGTDGGARRLIGAFPDKTTDTQSSRFDLNSGNSRSCSRGASGSRPVHRSLCLHLR